MKNTFLLLSWLILLPSGILANPIKEMLERIDKGASDKFVVELHKSSNDFFELDQKGDKVVIIDDLIATGGTLEAAAKLVEQLGGEVVRIVCLIELTDLKGREKLKNYDVRSIVTYEGE